MRTPTSAASKGDRRTRNTRRRVTGQHGDTGKPSCEQKTEDGRPDKQAAGKEPDTTQADGKQPESKQPESKHADDHQDHGRHDSSQSNETKGKSKDKR